MLGLDARALAVDLGRRVGEIELDVLDVTGGNDVDAAFAARFQPREDLVLDLQVPRVVELAGLQHGARRRDGVAAALHFDGVEERAVRLVVIGVQRAAHDVARREVDELVRPGADRLQVVGRLPRLRALVRLEQMLGDDHAARADERIRPERRRLRVLDAHRVGVDGRHFDVLVRADGDRCGRRVGRVLPVEHDVGRRERLAVVPLHILFQLPGDRLAVLRHAAVFRRRNLGREDRNQVAVVVPARKRLVEDARAVLILGARREVRIEKRRALPPQHLQRPAAAPLGAFVARRRLRLRDARVHQQLPGDRRRDSEGEKGRDEIPARDLSFPYLFDQTPQLLLIHDFLHASLVSAGAAQ